MPDISSLPIPRYNANDPYYYAYDNKPLDALEQIINLINAQVDINTQSILTAGGSYDLAQRLNVSLYDNGTLKSTAVNNTLHNIGYHTDGMGSDGISYVRMKQIERDKLATIDSDANNLEISVDDDSTGVPVLFSTGTINIKPSSTIIWNVGAGNEVSAEVTTSLTNSHQHYDNTVPISSSLTPDFRTYLVNGPNFMAGSLKVYINGLRIFPAPYAIYVPSSDPSLPWGLNSFTENGTTGFTLTNAITQDDIIMVDFTVSLS